VLRNPPEVEISVWLGGGGHTKGAGWNSCREHKSA